jgi:hypothetical protein
MDKVAVSRAVAACIRPAAARTTHRSDRRRTHLALTRAGNACTPGVPWRTTTSAASCSALAARPRHARSPGAVLLGAP